MLNITNAAAAARVASGAPAVDPQIESTPGGMLAPVGEMSAAGVLQDVTSIQKSDIEARLLSMVSKVERDTVKGLIQNTA